MDNKIKKSKYYFVFTKLGTEVTVEILTKFLNISSYIF